MVGSVRVPPLFLKKRERGRKKMKVQVQVIAAYIPLIILIITLLYGLWFSLKE